MKEEHFSNLRCRPYSFNDLQNAGDIIGFDILFHPECVEQAISFLTSPLPTNWEKHWDYDHAAYYYCNKETGDISWDHPEIEKYKNISHDFQQTQIKRPYSQNFVS